MRPMGFSTGALALGDFRKALKMLEGAELEAVELSALRISELDDLVAFGRIATLPQFQFVSVHAPGKFAAEQEAYVAQQLGLLADRGWPVVLHPDAIFDYSIWRGLGSLLLIENMDKRKRIGRTADELSRIYSLLPEAQLCFDVAHARQYDSSMTEAYRILSQHGDRVRQVHISDVNSSSRHDRLSPTSILAYRQIASMIRSDAPVILETPLFVSEMRVELERARMALSDESTQPRALVVGR